MTKHLRFDPAQLRRAWWTTPVQMTATLFVIFSLPSWLGPAPLSPVPLALALFFGLCGMGWGYKNSNTAQAMVGNAFNVTYLEPSHPLSHRVGKHAGVLGLAAPRVGVMAHNNAFAVGANASNAAVILGKPLLDKLASDELDAVIGHELGHIATDDMRRMQFAEGYQRMFSVMLSVFLANLINAFTRTRLGNMVGHGLASLARVTFFCGTELIVKGTSRKREFYADAMGAALSSPDAMSRALTVLHGGKPTKPEREFACLMFHGSSGGLGFSTHPTLAQRVAALEAQTFLRKLNGDTHPGAVAKAVTAFKVSKRSLLDRARKVRLLQNMPTAAALSKGETTAAVPVAPPKRITCYPAVPSVRRTEPSPLALPLAGQAMAVALVPLSVSTLFAVFVVLPGLTSTRGHRSPIPQLSDAPARFFLARGTPITTAALQPSQPAIASRPADTAPPRQLPLQRFTWTSAAILAFPSAETEVGKQHLVKLSPTASSPTSTVPPPVRRPPLNRPLRRHTDPEMIVRLYSVAPLLGQLSQYASLDEARRAESNLQQFLSGLRRPTSTEITVGGSGVTHLVVHVLQQTSQCWHYTLHAHQGKRQIAATNLIACPGANRRWRIARHR